MKIATIGAEPEIFHSLQGEGLNAGLPTVFIRLSLCNLHCRWCDTPYTWNWEGASFDHPGPKFRKEAEVVNLTVAEILKLALAFDCSYVSITGGEPLLQQKELASLAARLKRQRPQPNLELETNCTIRPSAELDSFIDQYNVSPKLANSGIQDEDRIVGPVLRFFASTSKANFKFVINDPNDITEVRDLQRRFDIPTESVFLMAQARDRKELTERNTWLARACRDLGYRMSDRLQVQLFGAERGR